MRLRRGGRNFPCNGHTGKKKIRFNNADDAHEYLRERNMHTHMRVYSCPACKGWHLAQKKGR